MLVRGKLFPIARGEKSKSGKMPVTFINSYFGKKDSDGLFIETKAVDCWMSADYASKLSSDASIDALLDINGDMILLKEFNFGNRTFVINDKGIAELSAESGFGLGEDDEKGKGKINKA